MSQKHVVQLGDGDRRQLQSSLRKGRASAPTLTHTRILLKATDGMSDDSIAALLEVARSTVYRVRRCFIQQELYAALHRRPQPARPQQRKLDGDAEAHLIGLVCGTPPDGRDRWTLRLLADRMVELEYADSLSHEDRAHHAQKTN